MRIFISLLLAVVFLLTQVPRSSAQAVVLPTLYDDFNGRRINPDKWDVGLVQFPPAPPGYAETAIGQALGRIVIGSRAYGPVGASPGDAQNVGTVRLGMKSPVVTGVQVTVRVEDHEVTGCGALSPSRVFFRLNLNMFRDGPNPNPSNPDDQTNTFGIIYRLQASAAVPNAFKVQYFVFKCLNADCTEFFDFPEGSFQDVARGQNVTLGVETDPGSDQFILTKNSEPQQTVYYGSHMTYGENFTQTNLFKLLQVRHILETCSPRARGWMLVTFDNFRTAP